jgi:membrane-associated phospholipid phosphatase
MVSFIQTLPPRMLDERGVEKPPATGVRQSNLWILKHASIHANTFPSAHVAASIACALFLVWADLGVGLLFLFVAISISLGAVLGRYHYAADAILGAAAAVAAFVIEWMAR